MTDSINTRPITRGETHRVTALRLNDDGDGVATIAGMTVFIPFLLPGEEATVRITDVQRRFARASLLERHSTSEDRQDAPCPVFGECGGCQVQHLKYDAQLQWKENRIKRMARFLGLNEEAVVRPIFGSKHPFRYRNQVQMPFRVNDETGEVEMGFYGPQTHRHVPTDSCHLQSKRMQATLNAARSFLARKGNRIASMVHHVIVRESATTGEQIVVFAVFRTNAELKKAFSEFEANGVKTVGWTVQPKLGGPVWGRRVEVLKGPGEYTENIGDISFRVSPRSFLQVQTGLAERLYETVREYAGIESQDTVIDGYCGIGTLTLMLAKDAGRVIGIEEVQAAVEDATANQEKNGITNAEFVTDKVEHWLGTFVEEGNLADVVVVDPPRKGVDKEALAALMETKPRSIVYVSCNPATLARDLKLLSEGGYQVQEMQPFDMFPQTAHVECVVRLAR